MISAAGFNRPTLDEIRQAIKDKFKEKFGVVISGVLYTPSLEPESFLGALAEIIAEVKNDLYEDTEDSYYSAYVGTANGVQLERVGLPTTRNPATKAEVDITFTGVAATNIPAGYQVETEDKRKYATIAASVISGGGTVTVACLAVVAGLAGNAPDESITFIPVPLAGVATAINNTPATGGTDIESDASYRDRIIDAREAGITSSLAAIINKVREVLNVVDVQGYENGTPYFLNGLPAGSFQMTVRGGLDEDIARAIYDSRPAGVSSEGTTSVQIYDVANNAHTEKFSRVVDKEIWVLATLTVNSLYVSGISNDVVRQLIMNYIGGINPTFVESPGLAIGVSVYAWKAKSMLFDIDNPNALPGLADATILLGTAPGDVTHDFREVFPEEEAFTSFPNIAINLVLI